MSILVISPEAWSAHPVSKHNYARALAERGCRVLFLDPPSMGAARNRRDVSDVPGLEVVSGPPVMRGLRHLPAFIRKWIEARWLSRLEAETGERVEAIWLFENSRFFSMDFAGDRLKIYHQVDLVEDHHPRIAARTADIAFCTTDAIAKRLEGVGTPVIKVHHGAVLLREADRKALNVSNTFSADHMNVLLLGNLERADLDEVALARMVADHPRVLFHFMGDAGPNAPLRLLCTGRENARWWGRVSRADIPVILHQADVLLLAYKVWENVEQQASPHKLMEYLLSGKVIVSSWTAEYADKPGLIEMVPPEGDLPELFTRVLSDLPIYNSPEKQAVRRAFARDHSYDRQLDRIAGYMRAQGLSVPFSGKNS